MPGYITGKLLGAGIFAEGKRIKLTGLGGGFGAKLFGAGTSTSPAIMASTGANAIQFYVRHTGASGDNRLAYLRFYLQGGAGGECLRAFTTMNESAGTAHGAHISLSFAAGKSLSGLGVANRNTLHIPNDTSPRGTLAAVQAEAYCDGTSSDPSSAAHGLIRAIVDGGNATSQGRFKNFLLGSLPSGAYNSGNMFITSNDATATHLLRCSVNGTIVYLMATTTPVAP